MRAIKFSSAIFGVTSSLPSCHKQDSLMHGALELRRPSPAINKRHRLVVPAMSVINLPRSGGSLFTTPDGRTVDMR